MTLGVVVGKFYPFHLGHHHLMQRAREQVDHLVILVAFKPEQELPGTLRCEWIRRMHPDAEVIPVLDDIPDDSEPWAKRTLEVIAPRRPDVVFTSETYGEHYAAHLGCKHIQVDLNRTSFPISGTALRDDLKKNWNMLTPLVKAHFAKRVVALGVESSGTTTLAQSLAAHFQTAWVPEAGRSYWEARQFLPSAGTWTTDEFLHIARNQIRSEDELAEIANRILVCDTDALATQIWHRRYLGRTSDDIKDLFIGRPPDLYLLTAPDFVFVQDGTRESQSMREDMHAWFIETLDRQATPWQLISGAPDERLYNAAKIIEPLLTFPKLMEP